MLYIGESTLCNIWHALLRSRYSHFTQWATNQRQRYVSSSSLGGGIESEDGLYGCGLDLNLNLNLNATSCEDSSRVKVLPLFPFLVKPFPQTDIA